jgi:hypothetical protein
MLPQSPTTFLKNWNEKNSNKENKNPRSKSVIETHQNTTANTSIN